MEILCLTNEAVMPKEFAMTEDEKKRPSRDPRWLELRKNVLKRDGLQCQECGALHQDNPLEVHHLVYINDVGNDHGWRENWAYDEKFLIYCSGGGYGGIDGAIILSLPENTTKFDFEKYLGSKLVSPSVSCSYYSANNTVRLFYYKDMEETKEDTVTYNLSTGSVE